MGVEDDGVVTVHEARDGLAAQQGLEGDDLVAEEAQRTVRPDAECAHPARHPVSDAEVDPTGEELRERRGLHRRVGDIADGGGQDADAHPDPLGDGERGRGLGDAAAEPEVFDDPELVETQLDRRGGRTPAHAEGPCRGGA